MLSKVLKNRALKSNACCWRWLVGAVFAALVAFSYFLPVHHYYYDWLQTSVASRIFSHRLMRMQAVGQPASASAGRQTFVIILYWTSFFESKDFGVGTGSKPFAGCADDVSSANCLTTTDRGLLNDSDAVVFHGRDLNVQDLPPPGWRRPHQIFVFFLLESPIHTNLGLLQQSVFRHYFNRTMTYRRDSDVLNPYGRLLCNDNSSVVGYSSPPCVDLPAAAPEAAANDDNSKIRAAAIEQSLQRDSSSQMNSLGINLTEKNRTVAWFVSNCQTNSRRESLVRNVSRFIPVDVYGRCGNGRHQCASRVECDRMLSRYYRFYLSFENSLCPDYVTEKLYRPLAGDTVPVVYGRADYSAYLPAGSYVDSRDFESPEALADHLNKIMANDTLYLSYFRWRGKYTVDPEPAGGGWCPLCRFLRDTDTTKDTKTYSDMAAWWSGQTINRTC
jgi:alpha-1,3-fucosyltransferase